jgi:transcription termination/antitermination protein NusA
MKSDLLMAVNQICAEKELKREVILKAIEDALVSAYRRNYASATAAVTVSIDSDDGDLHVYCDKQVVEEVTDASAELTLAEAQQLDPKAEVGSTVRIERVPTDFGRIAAQTAKQVILQRIHEAERDALYEYYHEREGELINGTVQSIDYRTNQVTITLGKKAEGVLPADDQLPNDRFRPSQTVRCLIAEVNHGGRGPLVHLSRTHKNMLRRLLEREVPEIYNGVVEIKSVAREAGQRSKVAVAATQAGVDPVGSCVGMRGTRIQNIVDELGGERIDVVEWNSDVRTFISNALSPAKPTDSLLLEEGEARTAVVIVPDRQLSLAIGKEGQNARLAAKLTGWRIDIKSETEAETEGISEIKRQQLQMLRVRTLESKAPAAPDDLLSRAEWLLKERDKNAMTLDQVAKMLADAEPTEPPAMIEPTPVELPAAEVPLAADAADLLAVAPAPAEVLESEDSAPPYEAYTEVIDDSAASEDDEAKDAKKGKGKKGAKSRELVFDEDLGEVVAVRKRKRKGTGWGDLDY